jgi:hypothetical protein
MFCESGNAQLDEMALGDAYTIRVESLRDLIELSDREVAMLERKIREPHSFRNAELAREMFCAREFAGSGRAQRRRRLGGCETAPRRGRPSTRRSCTPPGNTSRGVPVP